MIDIQNGPFTFFATCPHGIEEVLKEELSSFGYQMTPLKGERAGVTFQTETIEEIALALLHSRIAGRIYLKLFSFDYKSQKELYSKLKKQDFISLFSVNKSIKIQTTLNQSEGEKNNTLYLSQITKDAIVDLFQSQLKKRPDVELKYPDIPFLQYIQYNPREQLYHLTFYVDLSGEALSNRQYRALRVKAPIRENLAAGIIALMDFNPSVDVFIDGMCGSGTFAIEALLKKADIPPSFYRIEKGIPFTYEKLNFFLKNETIKKKWKEQLQNVQDRYQKGINFLNSSPVTIYAYDIGERELISTKTHLQMIGLSSYVKTEKADILSIKAPSEKGIFFSNLPYGERLDDQDLEQLYYDLGEHLKHHYKGFKAYLLSANLPLRKKIGLMTKKRIPLMNGGIECRLWEYHLY